MGCAKKPPLSGEVARRNAGTERLQQICDDLSVSLRLTASLRGEPRGAAHPVAFPYEGKVAWRNAGTERLQQICDDL